MWVLKAIFSLRSMVTLPGHTGRMECLTLMTAAVALPVLGYHLKPSSSKLPSATTQKLIVLIMGAQLHKSKAKARISKGKRKHFRKYSKRRILEVNA